VEFDAVAVGAAGPAERAGPAAVGRGVELAAGAVLHAPAVAVVAGAGEVHVASVLQAVGADAGVVGWRGGRRLQRGDGEQRGDPGAGGHVALPSGGRRRAGEARGSCAGATRWGEP